MRLMQDPELLRAEFFLQIGLQSLRGGNLKAAQSRLQTCREGLLALPEDQRHSSEVRVQLGAVCGSQASLLLSQVTPLEFKNYSNVKYLEGLRFSEPLMLSKSWQLVQAQSRHLNKESTSKDR